MTGEYIQKNIKQLTTFIKYNDKKIKKYSIKKIRCEDDGIIVDLKY